MKKIFFVIGGVFLSTLSFSNDNQNTSMPNKSKLVLSEDWSSGSIDSNRWYVLQKKWGKGNNGVSQDNVFISKDVVNGTKKNVLICEGHGDNYDGTAPGWNGHKSRVGGVIVSKDFFASGKYEVVMKIGGSSNNANGSKPYNNPIGMVPAIWTYSYKWVDSSNKSPTEFDRNNPLYNPFVGNEYSSENDFPELGKHQDFSTGLYNSYLNNKEHSERLKTLDVADGKYHTFTSIWRTNLSEIKDINDSQVVKYKGYWWVQDKSVKFSNYYGNPLKKLGKDKYSVYQGKEVSHFIDGKFVGKNTKYVPSIAGQLNIGVWFPSWGGKSPWNTSQVSVASIKVWQFDDSGDVKGIITKGIPPNMHLDGTPLKK